MEQHDVNVLSRQLGRLELEKEQKTKDEVKDLRARLYWIEDMIERSTNATQVHRKLLVKKTTDEVKKQRACLYWVEEDMIERSTNATQVHRKLLVKKTTDEVKKQRACLYWVEEDMIEWSTNATQVHRKLLEMVKKEREQRANKAKGQQDFREDRAPRFQG